MATGGSGDDVIIRFGANIDDIKSKMNELTGVVGRISGQFVAMAAVAAGGAVFGSFIQDSIKLNSEALQLSKTLGITAEEAGTLNTALGDIGSDADAYTGAFTKFTRALRTNSEELRAMGVDVDGVRSGQKSSNEAFAEALTILQKYAPGIDRAQASQVLFGRNLADVQKLQKLFGTEAERTKTIIDEQGNTITTVLTPMEMYRQKMEEARQKNEQLNLTITNEGLAAVKAYKEALNDAGDVITGVKKTIGDALMPLFTELSQNFSSNGPAMVEVVQAVAGTMASILRQLITVGELLWDTLSRAFSAVGDAIAQAFGGERISAMQLFKNMLTVIEIGFIGFRIAVELGAEIIRGAFLRMESALQTFSDIGAAAFTAVGSYLDIGRQAFTTFAEIAQAAINLDWDGVVAATGRGVTNVTAKVQEGAAAFAKAFGDGMARDEAIAEASMKRIGAIASKGMADIDKAAMGGSQNRPAGTVANKAPGGGQTYEKPDSGAVKAALAVQQAIDQAALALQLENLRQQQAINEDAYKNNLITIKEFYDAKLAIETKALDLSIAAKQREADSLKTQQGAPGLKDAQVLQLKAQEMKALGEINVLESKRTDLVRQNAAEYLAAERQRADALETIRINGARAAAQTALDMESETISQRRAMLQISAEEEIALRAEVERRAFDTERSALQARLELVHGDAAKRAELLEQMEQLEDQHQLRLTQINNQATRERAKYAIEANRSIRGNFVDLLNDLMDGTKKLSTAFRDFAMGVVRSMQDMIARKLGDKIFDSLGGNKVVEMLVKPFDMAIDWLVGLWAQAQELMTLSTLMGTSERTAAEEGAQEEGLLMMAANAVKRIAIAAWEAAASVYASIAAIPYVGPFLAPAAAIAAGAVVLGFAKNIASAEGGWWSVPQDQVAAIHKNEMVLPAAEAQGIRQLISDAKGPGGRKSDGGGGTFVVNAMDARSVKRLLMENAPAVAEAVRAYARNGGIPPKS